MKTFIVSTSITALGLLTAGTAQAQQNLTHVNPETRTQSSGGDPYWTPERFKNAKPLLLPKAASTPQSNGGAATGTSGPSVSRNGAPPSVTPPAGKRLYTPDSSNYYSPQFDSGASSGIAPQDAGTFGAHFTSTRVFPIFTGTSGSASADRAYPYRTVGKLFFSVNGSPSVCSASVIQRRIVATAGHCVHSGTSSGFYSNFVFVPAFRDGVAPFQSWNWSAVIVTGAWASGGGGVPNAADYAMIEFNDNSVNGVMTRIGLVTGWLGFQTLALSANHTTKLGYPCNLDSCQKMQAVYSDAFRNVSPNNVEYGSDARGGSSGGPWVQNFEQASSGQGGGLNTTAANRVVGITSYGYISTDPKVQGSSILDSRWTSIYNSMCARRAGNCS